MSGAEKVCLLTGVGPGTGAALARRYSSGGYKVAMLARDAVIDVPWTREALKGRPDEFFCKPEDIAEECFKIAHQRRSTWSSDVVIRPYCEEW